MGQYITINPSFVPSAHLPPSVSRLWKLQLLHRVIAIESAKPTHSRVYTSKTTRKVVDHHVGRFWWQTFDAEFRDNFVAGSSDGISPSWRVGDIRGGSSPFRIGFHFMIQWQKDNYQSLFFYPRKEKKGLNSNNKSEKLPGIPGVNKNVGNDSHWRE